jgi:hypothetical protein
MQLLGGCSYVSSQCIAVVSSYPTGSLVEGFGTAALHILSSCSSPACYPDHRRAFSVKKVAIVDSIASSMELWVLVAHVN